MKKVLRLTSLVLTLLMLIFTFCGCTAIDEARKNHGIWKDADKTVIELGGKEYKLLPECQYLNPSVANDYDYVSVTEKDVPLLCKEIFGEQFLRSDDGIFLVSDLYDIYTDVDSVNPLDSGKPLNYCVSDRYDEISGRINGNIKMDRYCYTYYDDNYNSQMYYFSDEEINAVNRVLQSEEISVYGDGSYYIDIYRCSEDGIFTEYCLDLMLFEEKMCLRVQSNFLGSEKIDKYYAVSDELKGTFDKITEKYMENFY